MTNGHEFEQAAPILAILHEAGYEAYFVGGAVRDYLLELPIHDVDIATSAYPAEVQALFPRHFDVGIEHGTIMVWFEGETYEITTFRTESTYQDFRRPDKVTFVQNLEEDLLRRDFTINALAMTDQMTIVDYFEGKADLKAEIIRAVGVAHDRFHEDGLRMMRGVRFASQLDFDIEAHTLQAIEENAAILAHIAVERITVEMNKLWIGKNWQKGLAYFLKSGLYLHVPGLSEYATSLQLLLTEIDGEQAFDNAEFAWSLMFWCHFVQSGETDPKNMQKAIRQLGKAWKMSNQAADDITAYFDIWYLRSSKGEWDLVDYYGKNPEKLLAIEAYMQKQVALGKQLFADLAYPADPQKVQSEIDRLPIHSLKELAINGRVIIAQINPDNKREIGLMLSFLETAVLELKVANEEAALLTYLREHYQAKE
ncbi:CCA tRNA nucleotidyltransferase [Aerococcus sp. 1KP-2016]|uniref:CCA tRNA nucleotidyltransferase n=1 Tax=Aerococcus sp. 1KP-2016 TaxID=1981982 RepID=UPI000B99394A|nr:CCA tRNA nucleotidyltransferase [Aerococcus sp. 1KP-2016]OYQ66208.1 CCA tRNA nucleotidyltransferase [Aerococcus sp. 1KP-2016]